MRYYWHSFELKMFTVVTPSRENCPYVTFERIGREDGEKKAKKSNILASPSGQLLCDW